MKRIFVAIFVMFLSTFTFAEHIFSLNVGPHFSYMGGNMDDIETYINDVHFSLIGEYDYFFQSNFLLGAKIGVGIGGIQDTRDGSTMLCSITNINCAPEFGFKLGRKNLFTLLILPFDFSFSFANDGKIGKVNLDYEAQYLTFAAGLKMNFQWGERICRNGFFVSIYLPWLKTITKGTLNNVELEDKSFVPLKTDFVMDFGYRISFVK